MIKWFCKQNVRTQYTLGFLKRHAQVYTGNTIAYEKHEIINTIADFAKAQIEKTKRRFPNEYHSKVSYTQWNDILKYECMTIEQLRTVFPDKTYTIHLKNKTTNNSH